MSLRWRPTNERPPENWHKDCIGCDHCKCFAKENERDSKTRCMLWKTGKGRIIDTKWKTPKWCPKCQKRRMKKYLLYIYRGQLKITEIFWEGGSCRKVEDPSKWHSKVNRRPLTFEYGKIWCFEKDLDKAIEMMREHYSQYAKNITMQALKAQETNCFGIQKKGLKK